MVKTNILGAMNVIEAAQDAQVGKVVALSTDKAYQPISPYGQSKALAESLFLNANQTRGKNGPRCSVVRYGNIWGSNGSVVPKWKSILATGAKTVPVTHPLCSRFYMTLDQAVGLVFDTIGTMEGGELRIPSLPAYRIGDLAEAMGAEMDITGLPAWEKRAESMRDGESSDDVRRMSVQELRQLL
jgi:UDP-N-acetylglucosamine 4,6-dehydratase